MICWIYLLIKIWCFDLWGDDASFLVGTVLLFMAQQIIITLCVEYVMFVAIALPILTAVKSSPIENWSYGHYFHAWLNFLVSAITFFLLCSLIAFWSEFHGFCTNTVFTFNDSFIYRRRISVHLSCFNLKTKLQVVLVKRTDWNAWTAPS